MKPPGEHPSKLPIAEASCSQPVADIHLIWEVVRQCNFRCSYCLAGSNAISEKPLRVDAKRVRQVLNATGRSFELNLVGGEPSVIPGFVELCRELSREHHLFLSTNLLRRSVFEEFSRAVDPQRVTGIDASFHVMERERLSSFEAFAESFGELSRRGFKIQANYVAHPSLLDRIDADLKRLSELGVEAKASPFIGTWQGGTYPESYSPRERRLLFSQEAYAGKWEASVAEKRSRRLCNAGYNVLWVGRGGEISRCSTFPQHLFGNLHDHIEEPEPTLFECEASACPCPYYSVLGHYYRWAERECARETGRGAEGIRHSGGAGGRFAAASLRRPAGAGSAASK